MIVYRSIFLGKHWDRAVKEIPCLNLVKIEEPLTLDGHKVSRKNKRNVCEHIIGVARKGSKRPYALRILVLLGAKLYFIWKFVNC